MFPRAAAATRPAFMSSLPCQRCLVPSPFLDSPGSAVTAVFGVLSNTEMFYLSVSCWRDGHGCSKYLLLLFCPVCLNAGRRALIVRLQGNSPTHLYSVFPIKTTAPKPLAEPCFFFREGMNHIKSSAPSIRLDCCQRIAAGEVQADLAAAVQCRGPGILTSGMAWSHGFPIPNGEQGYLPHSGA